jgi:cytochrome c peroxidase
MKRRKTSILLILAALILAQCNKDLPFAADAVTDDKNGPTPHHLKVPSGFPDYFLDADNRLTEEGIALGKALFFDPILSRDRNVSCASCHAVEHSFADPRKKSVGTHGEETGFHSMPIFNIAWMTEFFWNGRAKSREAQALQPVVNPVEMDMTWPEAVERIKEHAQYPAMFEAAFGEAEIDSNLVAQALVQYEMTLVSANTKYDRWLRGDDRFTAAEESGFQIFFDASRGDCFHCHNGILLTDNAFHNNGLDDDADLRLGLQEVTHEPADLGKFKTPTLRNLVFTAPYMHDGRYQTLAQVINFYSDSVQANQNVDVLMHFAFQGGVKLSDEEKSDLLAFLLTFTDSSFVQVHAAEE